MVSAGRVGPDGKVWGLDMTPEMLDRARTRAATSGATNVEFLQGYIEDVPLPDASVDVVISNCVIVLSPDKSAVFREIARVMVPGGRLAIADLVLDGESKDGVSCCQPAANCGDPVDARAYRHLMAGAGLVGISIAKSHDYAPGVFSAAIRAERPLAVEGQYHLRRMSGADWPEVQSIYRAGMDTGHATFEIDVPDSVTWDRSHLPEPRLVAVASSGRVIGWVAGSAVSDRCVYGGVIEHSVYVDPSSGNREWVACS